MRAASSATYLGSAMILVRNRAGLLYFLAREGKEALESLRRAYPGRTLTVVREGDGLSILRVGEVAPGGASDEEDRLAIVQLSLPPLSQPFPFRAGRSVPFHA